MVPRSARIWSSQPIRKFMKFGTLKSALTRRAMPQAIRNGENYVMTKANLTLTQSGLLALLLQHQRYRVFQLDRRSAHRRRVRAALWHSITWLRRALTMARVASATPQT